MNKALTLIEVLVAVAIFSALSVSLYMFLRTGIQVREKIDVEQAFLQDMYLKLDRLAQELRNRVSFKNDDPGFPVIRGDQESLEFYSLGFDYVADVPKILHITYSFSDKALKKSIDEPYRDASLKSYVFMEDLERIEFYYYDDAEIDEAQRYKQTWPRSEDESDIAPAGIRFELVYKDKKGKENILSKYIFLYPRKQ